MILTWYIVVWRFNHKYITMCKYVALVVLLELQSIADLASTQNLQISAQPATVDLRQDDLVILCFTTSLSQSDTVYHIQLQKNNSGSTLDNVVTVRSSGGTDVINWQDTALQNRATTTGSSVSSPQTAQLRLTIPKDNVQCPADFTGYKCSMSAFTNALVNQETGQIPVSYRVQPTLIEMPRVRILGEFSDTAQREFPVGTAIQLTCNGQIGSDPSATIRWCAKTVNAFTSTGLPQTPIHSEVSLSGCQYTRSSTITYNLTSSDTYTQFLCESGDSGLCETGTAKQYFNISTKGSVSPPKDHKPADDDTAVILGSVVGTAVLIGLLIIVVFVYRRYTCALNIGVKENSKEVVEPTSDSNHSGCYINMAAHNEQTERDHYEQLPERGEENQYDHLSGKENPETARQTYETLQDSAGESKYEKLSYDKDKSAVGQDTLYQN